MYVYCMLQKMCLWFDLLSFLLSLLHTFNNFIYLCIFVYYVLYHIQELHNLWRERAKLPWGRPESNFSEEEALLLLDDDHFADDLGGFGADTDGAVDNDDNKGPHHHRHRGMSGLLYERVGSKVDQLRTYVHALYDHLNAAFPGNTEEAASKRESLKRIFDDIDGPSGVDVTSHESPLSSVGASMTEDITDDERMKEPLSVSDRNSPHQRKFFGSSGLSTSGKKAMQSNILQGDLDSQDVDVDVMLGNTYATPRIPANWDGTG